ncbi:DUF4998 domain-containing protein [uncultured Parabacteroides sp.]|uniref:DUF4998 domain-containing protein n=1 Tax=uncultured Parabacteroides sp. TaxID=512312 RepID=UPI002593210C|nr:DUF4998 domain-containing protein [uncultured Parabacteroides sp.]
MKHILSIITIVSFIALSSCSGMNDIIEEYLDRGELNYIGKADSVICEGGLHRVRLKWKVGKDIRIEECKITWNMGADSIFYSIDRAKLDNGYASLEIPLEEEGQYVFNLIQMGEKGDPSIPSEVVGKVYGDKYISTLIPRSIRSTIIENGVAVLTLGTAEGSFYSEVSYINNKGKAEVIRVESEITSITIDNFVYGGDISVKTYFKPETNAIDIFDLEVKGKFPLFEKLNRNDWTIPFVSSQREDIFPVTNILDGNVGSLWHSEWTSTPVAPFPHCIIIDMNEEKELHQLEIFQDPDRMTFKSAKIFVSRSNIGDDSYTEQGTIHCPQSEKSAILALPTPQKARYIKLVFEESYNPPYVAISEVYAYGK